MVSVVACMIKERGPHTRLLRCVGFSRKKAMRLFLMQGTMLFLTAFLLAGILSPLLAFLIQWVPSLFGSPFYFRLTLASYLTAAAIGVLSILVPFVSILSKSLPKAPLETAQPLYIRQQQRSQKKINLYKLWRGANKRAYRSQNTVTVLLIFFCMAMTVFGSFLPLFNARGLLSDPQFLPQDGDYEMYIRGGSSIPENFYLSFPRSMGISQEMVNSLEEMEGVKIVNAYTEHMNSQFFLCAVDTENPLLRHYLSDKDEEGTPRNMLKNSQADTVVEQAGGEKGDVLLKLPVLGMKYECMKEQYPQLTSGNLEDPGYLKGEKILGPDTLCKVGDEYTIVTPVAPEGATEENLNGEIKFHVEKVSVAGTYPADDKENLTIVMSAEAMMDIDPSLRYERVLIKNEKNGDPVAVQKLEETLASFEARSENVTLSNFAEMGRQFSESVRTDMIQTIISVTIFIVMVILAIVLSTRLKVRFHLYSYVMMRALGARQSVLYCLITREILRLLAIGGSIGTIAGFCITGYFAMEYLYMQTWDIFLFYVAPSVVCVFGALCLLSRVAIRKPIKALLDKSIVEELNSTEQ